MFYETVSLKMGGKKLGGGGDKVEHLKLRRKGPIEPYSKRCGRFGSEIGGDVKFRFQECVSNENYQSKEKYFYSRL
jgi:hypothetical protein